MWDLVLTFHHFRFGTDSNELFLQKLKSSGINAIVSFSFSSYALTLDNLQSKQPVIVQDFTKLIGNLGLDQGSIVDMVCLGDETDAQYLNLLDSADPFSVYTSLKPLYQELIDVVNQNSETMKIVIPVDVNMGAKWKIMVLNDLQFDYWVS